MLCRRTSRRVVDKPHLGITSGLPVIGWNVQKAAPSTRPVEHFVFLTEKVGAAGDPFDAKVFDTDPTKPVGNIKEAWESAKKRTQGHCPNCRVGRLQDSDKPATGYVCNVCRFETAELPLGLIGARFHDLRHTAVSRMIAARVPLPIVAKIVDGPPARWRRWRHAMATSGSRSCAARSRASVGSKLSRGPWY